MAKVFGRGLKRFSIDDAFEEENDEAIKVYGSTTERSPLKPKNRNLSIDADSVDGIIVSIEEPGLKSKLSDDTLSRDSDSLIQDGYSSGFFDPSQSFWHHPKVRENWKTVLAAFLLLIIGAVLLVTGAVVVFLPDSGLQGFVFVLTGGICFIPGAYHVVYVYLAVQGRQGSFICGDLCRSFGSLFLSIVLECLSSQSITSSHLQGKLNEKMEDVHFPIYVGKA